METSQSRNFGMILFYLAENNHGKSDIKVNSDDVIISKGSISLEQPDNYIQYKALQQPVLFPNPVVASTHQDAAI